MNRQRASFEPHWHLTATSDNPFSEITNNCVGRGCSTEGVDSSLALRCSVANFVSIVTMLSYPDKRDNEKLRYIIQRKFPFRGLEIFSKGYKPQSKHIYTVVS